MNDVLMVNNVLYYVRYTRELDSQMLKSVFCRLNPKKQRTVAMTTTSSQYENKQLRVEFQAEY